MKARYIRVSSKGQNVARQEKHSPNEVVFTDIISGTVPFNQRPQAKQLLFKIANNEIDEVRVASIDRLGRNTIDILQTLEILTKQGINVHVDNLGLDSILNGKPNPVFGLITSVMATLSQMEREQLRERQLQGIAAAKRAGTYKGREKGSKESDDDFLAKYPKVVKLMKDSPEKSNNYVASMFELSPHTVKKLRGILEIEKGAV